MQCRTLTWQLWLYGYVMVVMVGSRYGKHPQLCRYHSAVMFLHPAAGRSTLMFHVLYLICTLSDKNNHEFALSSIHAWK